MNLKKQVVNFSILDALRGFAALYVCIAHARGLLWMGMVEYLKRHPYKTWDLYDYVISAVMSLTKLSGEFVIFFFVLSGFSIAHSLASKNAYLPFLKKRGTAPISNLFTWLTLGFCCFNHCNGLQTAIFYRLFE